MRSAEYDAYIRSPQWAAKRAQYWATLPRRSCQACGSTEKLHCHHMTYDRFKNELLSDLIGLCESCHEAVHSYHRKKRGSLYAATMFVVRTIKGGPVRQVTYVQAGKQRTVKVTPKKQIPKKRKKRKPNPHHGVKTGPMPQKHPEKTPDEMLAPDANGFVPKHLRGAKRVGSHITTATPYVQRTSWRP